MARKKLLEEDKKSKLSITIDTDLDNILEDYLEKNNLTRSKYIEKLVREDFEKKGIKIEREF
jgi:metal-responsive CopG/Arc/MetJ family transcriptional regulator